MDVAGDHQRIIRNGDRVTIFLKGRKFTATVTEARLSLGNFSISGRELLGENFGEHEIAGVELIVLPSSARDQMETMKRGPQVILPHDAATILFYAGITSGNIVLEAGSGSGGMTMALASAVATSGKIVSFDFKKSNTAIAERNVRKAGLRNQVEFVNGDIRDADTTTELLAGMKISSFDAVVLDMPDPWEAMSTARTLLKIGGAFVSYLPTMNQVERIRSVLEGWEDSDGGFIDIVTQETLRREIVVRKGAVRPDYAMLGHTGYLTFARRFR